MSIKSLICIIFLSKWYNVESHGSMITPRPRSAHNQDFDDRNKCGCENTPGGCYSNATAPGDYCGLGCIGESCLYYQIGCFQNCPECSYVGKTLYPVPDDLVKAGNCPTPPTPTLGGGDAKVAHTLRTYNIDDASYFGDWTAWNPWRSPGTAGRGNPKFQPCGVNSGSNPTFPDPPAAGQAQFANGTDLPKIPRSQWTKWKIGSVVEAEWSIYANHGGGYSYRLCKQTDGEVPSEACFQANPLDFATETTEIKYYDGSRDPFLINATTTSVGTFPSGSQWRKNPIPMCNCDIGIGCEGSKELSAGDDKKCHDTIQEECGTKTGYNTCLKCGSSSSYDCEECCPGLEKVEKDGYSYCISKAQKTCSDSNFKACFTKTYPETYTNGEKYERCPTGLMFPAQWDDGYGQGQEGRFMFSMTDKLQIPSHLEPGDYVLSWRWDCEQTPQVWNSCADVILSV
eukprot:g1279.t1